MNECKLGPVSIGPVSFGVHEPRIVQMNVTRASDCTMLSLDWEVEPRHIGGRVEIWGAVPQRSYLLADEEIKQTSGHMMIHFLPDQHETISVYLLVCSQSGELIAESGKTAVAI